MTVPLMKYL